MTIEKWEDRMKNSKEEVNEMPPPKVIFMEREITDLRNHVIELNDKFNYIKAQVKLLDELRHCMSYNDSYFGEPPGLLKGVIRQLAHTVDPTTSKEEKDGEAS